MGQTISLDPGSLDAGKRRELPAEKSTGLCEARTHFSSWTPLFLLAVAFIAGVSTYDGYLVVRTGTLIREYEKNPVGVFLIDCDDGDTDIFLRVKAAGTVIALTALSLLHHRSKRLAGPVELGLVVFQGGLLLFLENPFS